MPLYLFKNPEREEYVEVHQKMKDKHVFIDDRGIEWERVWTAPTTSIGLQNDADSSQQFVDKTKGWSVGDMWDYSKEMSEKRKSKRGYDHIGEAHEKKRQKEVDSRKPSNLKNKN